MNEPQILWRQVLQATLDTLDGKSKGQFDIRLANPSGIDEFFAGLPRSTETDLGGYEVQVPLEEVTNPVTVPPEAIRVSYIGARAQRKDWRIPSQRPETAYPLWRRDRAPAKSAKPGEDFIVLVRDGNSRFHARWLVASDVESLPASLKDALHASAAGVRNLSNSEWAEVTQLLSVPDTSAMPVPMTVEAAKAVGEPYRREDPSTSSAVAEPFVVDPDAVDRGRNGHKVTQNALADFLADIGIEPESPRVRQDPPFDLAWRIGEKLYVGEVKSITDANEEKQLRLALGQVLRYAHTLRQGGQAVRPVIVAEREPRDSTWVDLCDSLGVALIWPGAFSAEP